MFVVLLMMAPPSQELEPPANPARFKAMDTTYTIHGRGESKVAPELIISGGGE